jgi:hypothetical protein
VFIPRVVLLVMTVSYTLSAPVGALISRLRPSRGSRPEELPPPPPVEGVP